MRTGLTHSAINDEAANSGAPTNHTVAGHLVAAGLGISLMPSTAAITRPASVCCPWPTPTPTAMWG